jgi:hypothetical protein
VQAHGWKKEERRTEDNGEQGTAVTSIRGDGY